MPNPIAFLMLLIWPLVVYAMFRRMEPGKALVWTVLGGYLLLPPVARFDLPVVPDFDKMSIPNLSALAMSLFLLRDRLSILPDTPVGKLLIGLFVLSPFATVLTNGSPFPVAGHELPGMRIYDSVSVVANQGIALLPFFLARRYLATPEAMRTIAVALVIGGMIYSIPMLIEVRLSPQMNVWVYGFFQHSFDQMIRFGGFRPIVFLPHGLWAAFFALMTVLSAVTLARVGPSEVRARYVIATLYLGAVLVLCKSVGPLAYAAGLVPVLLLAGRKAMLVLAAGLAAIAITYPLLRGLHLVPLEDILALAAKAGPERLQSLQFRFDNEEMLLNHANAKPLFGWGGYGRNHVFDQSTGVMLTVADGAWVIAMGLYGWLGYIAQFGLLGLPLLLLGREALQRPASAFSPFACLVALMLAANMVDLLPNATLIPFTWLMAGSLLGYVEALAVERRRETRAKLHHRTDGRSRTVL